MVVGEVAAGAAAGAHALFGYNRENFMYDRKQRQEFEFKVIEWRNTQASLWRDDVREIIGLTEKKMDTYLIVNTLQLGMCVTLFTEGRLEPGTPPWLLHFYMLTLGAAFMYLLMSVWLAFHASVVAQCTSVRLLTQFVRLPIPTWDQLEQMRTYASSVESLEVKSLFRVPFADKRRYSQAATPISNTDHSTPETADPWGLEEHGVRRQLYELSEQPAALRRHVGLAQMAASQYQCYDAFARVAMSFGTNQLLNAIGYYCLGYVAVQDGAPFPALCVFAITASIAVALVHLDFSMTRKEQLLARGLIVLGPMCSSLAACAWTVLGSGAESLVMGLLPIAYASHGLWLFFALITCGLKVQPNGSVLPMKFRAVLYLDVFGWLSKSEGQMQDQRPSVAGDTEQTQVDALRASAAMLQSDEVKKVMSESEKARVQQLVRRIEQSFEETAFLSAGTGVHAGSYHQKPLADHYLKRPQCPMKSNAQEAALFDAELGGVASGTSCASGAASWKDTRSITAFEEDVDRFCTGAGSSGADVPRAISRGGSGILEHTMQAARQAAKALNSVVDDGHAYVAVDGESTPAAQDMMNPRIATGPSGEIPRPPPHAFQPASYLGNDLGEEFDRTEIVTGHDKLHPGKLPAKMFRLATLFMVFLWVVGLFLPLGVFREFMTKPLTADVFIEEMPGGADGEMHEEEVHAALGTGPDGLPELIPEYEDESLPTLQAGELVKVDWPSHSGFVPRSLSCDPQGRQLVVADDLGVYAGEMLRVPKPEPVYESGSGRHVAAAARSLLGPPRGQLEGMATPSTSSTSTVASVSFERVPPCTALEGQALKDIGVVCAGGARMPGSCRVVVLHARGRRLAECPLPELLRRSAGLDRDDPLDSEHSLSVTGASMVGKARASALTIPAEAAVTWTISGSWLHGRDHKEYVESVAVNSDCHRERKQDGGSSGSAGDALDPQEVGCVVVGTTSGRIVQLRGASTDDRRLVPERAMQQRSHSIGRGSIHVLPNGYVMALRRNLGTVQAFDSQLGAAVGEWRLPKGIRWLTLCGGGDSLFVLGLRNLTHVELYRFPVPSDLQQYPAQDTLAGVWHQGLPLALGAMETRLAEI